MIPERTPAVETSKAEELRAKVAGTVTDGHVTGIGTSVDVGSGRTGGIDIGGSGKCSSGGGG